MVKSVPDTHILLYHEIDSDAEPTKAANAADVSIVVDVEDFRKQLACLSEMGKRVVSLEQILSTFGDGGSADQVALTFDDGHVSNYTLAMPALLEARASATFYIIAGRVDADPNYVTSAHLREMDAHQMLIGSHTMTHPFLPQLSRQEIHRELSESRVRLEDILGRPVLDLAIPGGHVNASVFEIAEECGYRSVATCKVGVYRNGDDPFCLPRVEIRRELGIADFQDIFSRSTMLRLQLIETAKMCLRTTLGLSAYTRLRSVAHRCMTLAR